MAAGRPRRKRRWRPQPRLHLPADRGLPAGRGVGKSIASHRHRTGIATFQLSPSGLILGPRAGDGTVALDARVKPEHDDSADDGRPDGGSAMSALISPPAMLSFNSTAGSPPILPYWPAGPGCRKFDNLMPRNLRSGHHHGSPG